ncbi:MAG: hypothetical protein OEL83_10045 [Desulforhopalus sp.]|nr:hypothetical protein [Desulforhopalus sp.]
MKHLRTCVTPAGTFQYGIHKPSYTVSNLRQNTRIEVLGLNGNNTPVDNTRNYPLEDVPVAAADWIYEIPNPFPFRGCTYIDKEWADASAINPGRMYLGPPAAVSLSASLQIAGLDRGLFGQLPEPLLLALATCSTDPEDLVALAGLSCEFVGDHGRPTGLRYREGRSGLRPVIHNHALYEAVANNRHLPDTYKIIMVIRPGAQGASEIVGEWPMDGDTHVFEYLRQNSYIPGGHYAANMADDAIRYSTQALSRADIHALRHLYYQRTYVCLAQGVKLPLPEAKGVLSPEALEALRLAILEKLPTGDHGPATLWGWNYGFDFAPSHYRLHASHQQIHQQYAMVPEHVTIYNGGCEHAVGMLPSFSCGDMLAELIDEYAGLHGSDFFADYRAALAGNQRMDGRNDLPTDLVVWSDGRVMLFVPKAQTSQWELQLMTLPRGDGSLPGNILECDMETRRSLDTGILTAQKVLAGLGARMVTSIEYGKRLGRTRNQRQPLLYAFLPRLPESPGAFSEAQLRFINGHYPEDFAAACRRQLEGGRG